MQVNDEVTLLICLISNCNILSEAVNLYTVPQEISLHVISIRQIPLHRRISRNHVIFRIEFSIGVFLTEILHRVIMYINEILFCFCRFRVINTPAVDLKL